MDTTTPSFPPPDPSERVVWRWSGIGFPAGIAFALWMAAFVVGSVLSATIVVATGHGTTDPSAMPVWVVSLAVVGLWIPFATLVGYGSRTHGSGRLVDDLALRFRTRDLWGLPIGIACQLILVPVVTWLASRVAPGVFDYDEMETRARDLVDNAAGAWFALLFAVVAVGAPLVEEAVYRGVLQGSLRRVVHPWLALGAVAVLFAAIHFSVIEFPGLLAFSLVLGLCFERSGGLSMPVLAHVAFNSTALALLLVVR